MNFWKKKKHSKREEKNTDFLLSQDTPFAVKEAYKSLRNNIIFALPDDGCRCIQITSSIPHEGKSTTAVNLAIAFAESNMKTLLIDCDLRLPTIAQKLNMKQEPGLSNFLVGMASMEACMYEYQKNLMVIPAGRIPPNPSELLGAKKMVDLIESLKKQYEIIVFDTPPVTTVTDPSVLAKQMAGVVLVTRRSVSNRNVLSEAAAQLEFAGANILGFVFTGAVNEQRKYYKNYEYK